MTDDELRDVAIKQALFRHDIIERLLEKSHGDVAKALKLMTVKNRGFSPAQSLGSWSMSVGICRIECEGSAGSHPILAWHGPDYWDRSPDVVVKWREVFEYVENGYKRPVQLQLL